MGKRPQRKRSMSNDELRDPDDVRKSSDEYASDGGESEYEEETIDGGLSKFRRGMSDLVDPEDEEAESERMSKSRERNRLHARNTRERKKNQIQEYQRKIKLLMNERHHLNSLLVNAAVAGTLIPGAAQDPAAVALLWGQDALGAADAAAQDLQHQEAMLELKEKIKRESELLERIDGAQALKKDNNAFQTEDLINIRKERNRIHARKTRLRKKQALKEAELLLRTLENDVRRLRTVAISSLPAASRQLVSSSSSSGRGAAGSLPPAPSPSSSSYGSSYAALPSLVPMPPPSLNLSVPTNAGTFGTSNNSFGLNYGSQFNAIPSPFSLPLGKPASVMPSASYGTGQAKPNPMAMGMAANKSQSDAFSGGPLLGLSSLAASHMFPLPSSSPAAVSGRANALWTPAGLDASDTSSFQSNYSQSYRHNSGVVSHDETEGVSSVDSSPSHQTTPKRNEDLEKIESSERDDQFVQKDISIVSPADQSENTKSFLLPVSSIAPSISEKTSVAVASPPHSNACDLARGQDIKQENSTISPTNSYPMATMPSPWPQTNPMTYMMLAALQQQAGMSPAFPAYQAALNAASLQAGASMPGIGDFGGGAMRGMLDPRAIALASMSGMGLMGAQGLAASRQLFPATGMPMQALSAGAGGLFPYGGVPLDSSGIGAQSGLQSTFRPHLFSTTSMQQQGMHAPSTFPYAAAPPLLRPEGGAGRLQSQSPSYPPQQQQQMR